MKSAFRSGVRRVLSVVLGIGCVVLSPIAARAVDCGNEPEITGSSAWQAYVRWCRCMGGSVADDLNTAQAQGGCQLPSSGDDESARRAQEEAEQAAVAAAAAEAERKRQIEAARLERVRRRIEEARLERERLIEIKRQKEAEFIRDRDAAARTLRDDPSIVSSPNLNSPRGDNTVDPRLREDPSTQGDLSKLRMPAFGSTNRCSEIEKQLERDQEAMRRQQRAIEQGQAELADWTDKNESARKAALKLAVEFLFDSVKARLAEISEEKLAKLEGDFRKRAPLGETWQRKIEKARQFKSTEARLMGAIDGFKLAEITKTAADWWREVKEWAAEHGKDAEILDAILAEWGSDPELRQIMEENALDAVNMGLGLTKTFAPFASALDLGNFLVDYGYNAAEWGLSRNRIDQQIANRDQDLKAVEALKKQIERTVAKLKACRDE